MKKKTSLFLIFFLFFLPLSAIGATLFSDGFESGDFSNWTSAGSDWKIINDNAEGTKAAEVKNTVSSDLIKNISTKNYEDVVLSYWYKIPSGLDSSDNLKVQWFDGVSWHTIVDYTTSATISNWKVATFNLYSAANIPNFALKLSASGLETSDKFRVDGVSLTASVLHDPINGGWSDWSEKSSACGASGTQYRTCTNPAPAYGGADCSLLDGGNSERPYTNEPCPHGPINGGWTDWTPANPGTCGITVEQTRTCTNPAPSPDGANCEGPSSQTITNAACPVNGGWSDWGPASCPTAPGSPASTLTRTCTNPSPAFGGSNCVGESTQICAEVPPTSDPTICPADYVKIGESCEVKAVCNENQTYNEATNRCVDNPVTTGGGGNGGGGGSGSIGGKRHDISSLVTSGEVLGASIDLSGQTCSAYMEKFIRQGARNDAQEVEKLQRFLSKEMNLELPITGVYDSYTFDAVNAFQLKYADEILAPWGETAPTGIVYLTTLRKINMIECSAQTAEMPELIMWSRNPNAPKVVVVAEASATSSTTPVNAVDEAKDKTNGNPVKSFWNKIFGR